MSSFKIRLTVLEARLRALVEGGAVRLFGSKNFQKNLNEQLLAAMQAGMRQHTAGEWVAPNLYTISIHPSQLAAIPDEAATLEELAGLLKTAATESGLMFESPPVVRFLEDSQAIPNQISVTARISIEDLAQTSDLPVQARDNGAHIPEHAFLVVDGTHIFPLEQSVINIGRRPDNHLVIADGRVSRVHAQLRAVNGRYIIFDLDSSGGTFINDQRVQQGMLYPGDVISLAGVPIVFGQEQLTLGETQKLVPGSTE